MGPGTPQFNGRVRRKFATLYFKVRAMLNAAKLPAVKRKGLWTEAARKATHLKNILVSTRKPIGSNNAFTPNPQTIIDCVETPTRFATIPDEDPNDQSGRDGYDEDFDVIPDLAFLVAAVRKTLTPEQNKTGGFIIFLLGAPILWHSKAQVRTVALSSTEAKFNALSEAAKEIKVIVQVLISMGIPVKLPIIVQVDNVGAIFVSENVLTSLRTKHTSRRYHFVREFVEEGLFKVIFVRSEDDISDPFTKNTPESIYDKHTAEFGSQKKSMLADN
jgi:hypothetical protein